jgi:hypothetical protein
MWGRSHLERRGGRAPVVSKPLLAACGTTVSCCRQSFSTLSCLLLGASLEVVNDTHMQIRWKTRPLLSVLAGMGISARLGGAFDECSSLVSCCAQLLALNPSWCRHFRCKKWLPMCAIWLLWGGNMLHGQPCLYDLCHRCPPFGNSTLASCPL